jgi:hypothetical protein
MPSNLDKRFSDKSIRWLLALLLALAVAPSVLPAQEWDHIDGRDKVHDPTGAWLIRNSEGLFILTVFHEGGTLTGDVQGESGFFAKAPVNIINSPESGVWQKTGWKTFAATFLTIEYEAPLNKKDAESVEGIKLHQFDKVQFTGVLNESGDQFTLTARVTLFDANGNQIGSFIPDVANGIRIPLEILPSTAQTLPIPTVPPPPN